MICKSIITLFSRFEIRFFYTLHLQHDLAQKHEMEVAKRKEGESLPHERPAEEQLQRIETEMQKNWSSTAPLRSVKAWLAGVMKKSGE